MKMVSSRLSLGQPSRTPEAKSEKSKSSAKKPGWFSTSILSRRIQVQDEAPSRREGQRKRKSAVAELQDKSVTDSSSDKTVRGPESPKERRHVHFARDLPDRSRPGTPVNQEIMKQWRVDWYKNGRSHRAPVGERKGILRNSPTETIVVGDTTSKVTLEENTRANRGLNKRSREGNPDTSGISSENSPQEDATVSDTSNRDSPTKDTTTSNNTSDKSCVAEDAIANDTEDISLEDFGVPPPDSPLHLPDENIPIFRCAIRSPPSISWESCNSNSGVCDEDEGEDEEENDDVEIEKHPLEDYPAVDETTFNEYFTYPHPPDPELERSLLSEQLETQAKMSSKMTMESARTLGAQEKLTKKALRKLDRMVAEVGDKNKVPQTYMERDNDNVKWWMEQLDLFGPPRVNGLNNRS